MSNISIHLNIYLFDIKYLIKQFSEYKIYFKYVFNINYL